VTRKVFSLFCLLTQLAIVTSDAVGIDAPPWTGPKEKEANYRTDWYACYRDAEKTVPPLNVQATGEQALYVAAIAMASRNRSVADLTVACMQSLGYATTPSTSGK